MCEWECVCVCECVCVSVCVWTIYASIEVIGLRVIEVMTHASLHLHCISYIYT